MALKKYLKEKIVQMKVRRRVINFKKRIIRLQKHKEKMRKNSSLVSWRL